MWQLVIGIVRWQCPDGMEVIRQQHPRVDLEWMLAANLEYGFPQGSANVFVAQELPPPVGDDREKPGGAGCVGATVAGRGLF